MDEHAGPSTHAQPDTASTATATAAGGTDETLSPARTWEQARSGATCAWWQLTALVELGGPDTMDLLDNVSTQHCRSIPPGEARHTLFLDRTASIIAPAVAYRSAEDAVLLEVQHQHVEPLCQHLARYRLRARVEIDPVELAVAHVVGPNLPGVLHAIAGATTEAAGAAAWYRTPVWGTAGIEWSLPAAGRELEIPEGLPAAAVVGSPTAVRAIVASLPAHGAPYADPEALDALRISMGVPFLNDFLDGRLPAEVGADALAVSFDKGCYLGQEPVARLHFRGRPNRTLRPVELLGDVPAGLDPTAPDYLELRDPDDTRGRAAGTLTSWALAPDGRRLGLATIHRRIEPGAEVELAGTDVRIAVRG